MGSKLAGVTDRTRIPTGIPHQQLIDAGAAAFIRAVSRQALRQPHEPPQRHPVPHAGDHRQGHDSKIPNPWATSFSPRC